MGGNCLNGGSNCNPMKGGGQGQNGNGSPLGWGSWGWGFPFAPWPSPSQPLTTSTVYSSTTRSLPSSASPRRSTASAKTSQVPVPTTTAVPSRASASTTATLLPTVTSNRPSNKGSATSQNGSPTGLPVSSPIPSQSSSLAATELSSIVKISVTDYPIPSSTTKAISASAASEQAAASQSADFTSSERTSLGANDKVVPIVVGILLGVVILVIPFVLFIYRRNKKSVNHRRSIGGFGLEKDPYNRPWKKSEMKLRGKSNRYSTTRRTRSQDVPIPEPAFAPLRQNRSSSLYSGSILNSMEHLSQDMGDENRASRTCFGDGAGMRSGAGLDPNLDPFADDTSSSHRSSGYEYYDDPFRAPMYSPASIKTKTIIRPIRRNLSDPVGLRNSPFDTPLSSPAIQRAYNGKARRGTGVQRNRSDPTQDKSRQFLERNNPFLDPVEEPLASPTMTIGPPKNYKGKIRMGMGVQKRFSASTFYPRDSYMV